LLRLIDGGGGGGGKRVLFEILLLVCKEGGGGGIGNDGVTKLVGKIFSVSFLCSYRLISNLLISLC
jgi:hypothetical protein